MLVTIILPTYGIVNAAGTTPITDSDIINVIANPQGDTLTGELDYYIPSGITEDSAILTFDFGNVKAYKNGSTNDIPALDFSKYNFSGPIIVEDSYYYRKHKSLIDAHDYDALKAAGYPYWYTFSDKGIVELDYRAIYTYNDENGVMVRDYENLVEDKAESFVVFTCDLNAEAFDEAGGEFILSFVTDITDKRNPHILRDEPKKVKRDIEVTKECADFDFNGGTVQYTVSIKNNGAQAINKPIVITDTLDVGLTWIKVDSVNSSYITVDNTSDPQIKTFTLNNLPSGETTSITYTCELNEKFYRYNQNHVDTNGGNTITATTIPEGGSPDKPVAVELNPNGDTSIRAIPTDLKNYKEYVDLKKNGTYSNGVYDYTISINEGTLRLDLADAVLKDNYDSVAAKNVKLVDGSVTITNTDDPSLSRTVTGVTLDSFRTDGIKFDASWFTGSNAIGASTDKYTITYSISDAPYII